MDWPNRRATEPRHQREKSRVTLQLQPAEKNAIDWLARMPEPFRPKLPKQFRPYAGTAARTIARELSGGLIRELAVLHSKAMANAAERN
jgi:hypothetical protein